MPPHKDHVRVLIVEDTPSLATLYQNQLQVAGIAGDIVETGSDALEALCKQTYDVMLLDLQLPDQDGCSVLASAERAGVSVTTIMITAHGSVNIAVEAMRHGAYDFLMKPVSSERLVTSVRNAVESNRIVSQKPERGPVSGQENNTFGFIGSSAAMQGVYRMVESVARSQAPVFITGESGTGKEICAQSIHQAGPRKDGPFIAINCAAIPKDLIESEIFGHKKGAFTGATTDRLGAVMSASGGTLFLDEICEMDINLQAKLLRFLQTNQIQRVGDDKTQTVDVRIVSATNRRPIEEVAEGRFREDLYYRLHVLAISLPPLRDRGHDILELAEYFLKRVSSAEGKDLCSFEAQAQNWLLSHRWPGNVRQLENLITGVAVMNDGEAVAEAMLSAADHTAPPSLPVEYERAASAPVSSLPGDYHAADKSLTVNIERPLAEIEREVIEAVISRCDGSLPKAAHILGLSPSTLYRKREQWLNTDLSVIG
ncbi:sigma-54-dependent transcriptional regulator [Coralliovum pocilloporae]|uniref:sigma-54-dependent transcriptional regulator n=1 Tax=Coralliovum pocilloporae TaxID=3066369 RepID=UPI003307A8DF